MVYSSSYTSSVFDDLLQNLAEEHFSQLAEVEASNVDLKRQVEMLQMENAELQTQLVNGALSFGPTSSAFSRAMSFTGSMGKNISSGISTRVNRATTPQATGVVNFVKEKTAAASSFRARLRYVISSTKFEFFVASLVTASACVSALELQYRGLAVGKAIEYPGVELPNNATWLTINKWIGILDKTFTVIFTCELLLRVTVFGLGFFRQILNWLDIIAVTVSLLDLLLTEGGNCLDFRCTGGASVVRLLRLVKLTRGLRLVKMVRVLESLLFLLQCIRASVATLFWSLCVLTIIQCIAGMLLSQLVQDYIDGTTSGTFEAPENRREVYGYYGTFTRTMITMFEIHLANWAPACRVLVDNVGEWLGYVFVTYRCLAGFAVLHVINAVFIQQTMRVAQQDQDIMIMQKQKADEQSKRSILEFFKELDRSGDGTLSKDEFDALLSNGRLKTWLSCLEIEMNDVAALFEMLDHGDGDIDAKQFVRILNSIKGPAKSIDMAQLLARTSRIEAKLNVISRSPSRDTFARDAFGTRSEPLLGALRYRDPPAGALHYRRGSSRWALASASPSRPRAQPSGEKPPRDSV